MAGRKPRTNDSLRAHGRFGEFLSQMNLAEPCNRGEERRLVLHTGLLNLGKCHFERGGHLFPAEVVLREVEHSNIVLNYSRLLVCSVSDSLVCRK